jgi:phenylacetate-CoA ligase
MASIRWYSSGRRGLPDGQTDEHWSYPGPLAPHYTIDLHGPIAQLIDWLARRRPTYLLTFPSIAHEMAEHADFGRAAELSLKKIVGISEIVTEDMRASVRRHLGCEIAQIYACAEMGCIALQSAHDDEYLICEESVFVEILDDLGKPVGPGETGRVVLTSLYNYATPFIRYEIGDLATRGEQACPSGRTLARLRRIDGRKRNALQATNGKRVWPHQIADSDLHRHLPAQEFQIRQTGAQSIELIYVPKAEAPVDREQVAQVFAGLLGQPVNLTLSAVDRIPRPSGGKHERIILLD